MALPTQKHTRGRVHRARSHRALKAVKLTSCPKCHKEILPHYACNFCGFYKGQEVIKTEKKNKKAKKA